MFIVKSYVYHRFIFLFQTLPIIQASAAGTIIASLYFYQSIYVHARSQVTDNVGMALSISTTAMMFTQIFEIVSQPDTIKNCQGDTLAILLKIDIEIPL